MPVRKKTVINKILREVVDLTAHTLGHSKNSWLRKELQKGRTEEQAAKAAKKKKK